MAEPLPIVLIPGLNCSARLYAEQITALWRFGPVEIADHTRDSSMDAIAARILADAPPRFALAGLSMGGYLALTVMRQAPERVQKLALLDDLGAAGNAGAKRATQAPDRARRKRPIRRSSGAAISVFCPSQPPRRRGVARARAPHGRGDRSAGLLASAAGDHDAARCATLLAAIKCPTLVLVGDGDALTPPALSREIADGISGSRLVIVPDCGHLSTMEQPEAVNKALVEWMTD
jgi:pimeloyl-ACP methyl ester carboxylesterase